MATVTGLTADRMLAIEAASVVDGEIDGSGHLILTKHDGSTIDAGYMIASVPAASTTVQGIVELATDAEAIAGTDTVRAVTPHALGASIAAASVPDATTSTKGKVQLATGTEATTGTDATKAVTPAALATAVPAASTSTAGKVVLASDADAIAGTSTTKAVTPHALAATPINTLADVTVTSPVDGHLLQYSSGAFVNKQDLALVSASLFDNLIKLRHNGDTVDRFYITDVGTHNWGPGNAATDTNLYRNSAGQLKTDGGFTAVGSLFANDLGLAGLNHEWGGKGANKCTVGDVASSTSTTEVAIPSASWASEPTYDFKPGRLYMIIVLVGIYMNTGTESGTRIRVRTGAQSTSGTQIGFWQIPLPAVLGSAVMADHLTLIQYCTNTGGSVVSTKLSLTNQRITGATTTKLFGDSTVPITIHIIDRGQTSDQPGVNAPSV